MYKCVIQMMSLFSNVNITMAACCSDSSIHSSASLKKYGLGRLGFSDLSLKDEQRLSIRAVYDGSSIFMWLPTGFGKSLCYQILPFVINQFGNSRAVLCW